MCCIEEDAYYAMRDDRNALKAELATLRREVEFLGQYLNWYKDNKGLYQQWQKVEELLKGGE